MNERPVCRECWAHYVPDGPDRGSCHADPIAVGLVVKLVVIREGAEDQPAERGHAKVRETAHGRWPGVYADSPGCGRHPDYARWAEAEKLRRASFNVRAHSSRPDDDNPF